VAEKACGEVSMKGDLVTPKKRDEISFQVELITPIFGGGAKARELDPVWWLRPSAVKASLRFWWRALYGHEYKTSDKMHEAESRIFGKSGDPASKTGPGLVRVAVTEAGSPALQALAQVVPGQGNPLMGAYFSAAVGQGNPTLGLAGPKATLTLQFLSSDVKAQVIRALNCWLIYGGAGARTRRGAGAVAPVNAEAVAITGYPTTEDQLNEFLKRLPLPGQSVRKHFSLCNHAIAMRCQAAQATAAEAHKALLTHWRAFRQNRQPPPHFGGGQNWGLSLWPEGDVLRGRRIQQGGNPRHRKLMVQSNSGKAVRILLGAPLILHWKTGPQGEGIGDGEFGLSFPPPPGTPNRVFVDRFASPILLGIARVWEQGQARHVGVVLATSATFGLAGGQPALREDPGTPFEVGGFVPDTNRGARGYPVTDPQGMVQAVVQAFAAPLDTSVPTPHFTVIR
jgi:CRISPR/Cas system CMR-associated protein Cmr1 (group 7 of RAMP superfamily)